MAILKTLSAVGNSFALLLDRPILELLGISRDTPLEISTDGVRLIITPRPAPLPHMAQTAPTTYLEGADGATTPVSDPERPVPAMSARQPVGSSADGVIRKQPWMGNYAPARLIRPDHKVRLLVKENPKQPNSASRARFDRYRNEMRVDEALSAGIRPEDVRWDVAHGFIELY
jgi:hypothetical protein